MYKKQFLVLNSVLYTLTEITVYKNKSFHCSNNQKTSYFHLSGVTF
jgi:hypothetical protein